MSCPPIRVCLDARLIDGTVGGVQQAIMGVARGFRDSESAREGLDLQFLVWPGHTEWIEPHLPPGARLLETAPPARRARRVAARIPGARALWRVARRAVGHVPAPPESDGTVESSGAQVMHFTQQLGFRTAVPSIFQPHDLQHVHLPQFFSTADWTMRDGFYRAMCAQAVVVAALTEWGADDLRIHYGLAHEKVVAVPHGVDPVGPPSPPMRDAAAKLGLPPRYAFFPAQIWPHKNHRALIDALGLLRRDHDLTVPLICSGGTSAALARLQAHAAGKGVPIRFLGYLPPHELEACYRNATLMVFPSLFEGWGMPVTEAMSYGVPVACSNVTSLPFVAGDAARLFDPADPTAIAAAVAEVWNSGQLRQRLVRAGHARVATLSWTSTAEQFAGLYRRAAGRSPD